MQNGKLVVFEGIYGSGRLAGRLVNRVREALAQQGANAYEIDSPDSGRALVMGAESLDSMWRYGSFKPDFFFELASRAKAATVIDEERRRGRLVLCKGFTLSSIVYARLKGHDWDREGLGALEARARGAGFGGEVTPDLTIFLDMTPTEAVKALGSRIDGHFTPQAIERQRELYLEELAKLPTGLTVTLDAAASEDANVGAVLQAVGAKPLRSVA